jgi:hypothetical protein
MDAPVTRLSLNGRVVRYRQARLVMFHGWRLVLAGAMVEDGGEESDRTVEVAVDGGRYVGTVRTTLAPNDAADAVTRGREAVLMGIGDLRQIR